MALPVLTSNSPTAGSISWTAFGVSYGDGNYPVAAGSTASKYVWWEFNAGVPLVKAGNTLPDLNPAIDTLLFLNKNGIGAIVEKTSVMDGSLIVPQSILADAIAANQIDATHIAAGAVTADEIAAGAITTDKLSVGSIGDNLVVNGSFEEFTNTTPPMPIGWGPSVLTGGSADIVNGVSSSGANALRLTATAITANLRVRQTLPNLIPVSSVSGRRWYVAARMGVTVDITKGAYLRVIYYDANKVPLTSAVPGYFADVKANVGLTVNWTVLEGSPPSPPSAARYMGVELLLASPNVVTQMLVDEVIVREVVISAQIGDGAITAPKILAGSITGDRIQAGTILADRILISDFNNYTENGTFENDTVGQGAVGWDQPLTSQVVVAEGAGDFTKSISILAKSGVNTDVYGIAKFPVQGPVAENVALGIKAKPADQFYISAWVKCLNAAGTAKPRIGLRTYKANKATGVNWPAAITLATDATRPLDWTFVEGIATIPATAAWAAPWLNFPNNAEATNRMYVSNLQIRRMSRGELIVDGAIMTDHMSANTIKGDVIEANTLSGTKITADSIEAGKLKADAIDGKVITGSTLRTAETGARIELSGLGTDNRLFAVNSAGQTYFSVDDANGVSVNGNVTASGYTSYNGTKVDATLGVRTRTYQGTDSWEEPALSFTASNFDYTQPNWSAPHIRSDGTNVLIESQDDNYAKSWVNVDRDMISLNTVLTMVTNNLSVGGKINGRPAETRYAHFFGTSTGIPSGSAWGVGRPTMQPLKSRNGSQLGSFATNDAWYAPEDGIYSADWYLKYTSGTANTTMLLSLDGRNVATRQLSAAADGSVNITSFWVAAGGILRFNFTQTSGASRNAEHDIRIMQLA